MRLFERRHFEMEQKEDSSGNNWKEGRGRRVGLGKNMEKEVSIAELQKSWKPQSTSFSFETEET